MKKIYSLVFVSLAALLAINTANATVRIVTCQNVPSHFLPVTVNALCGDTVRWNWVAGNHVVGPINSSFIPVGAAMWNAPINSSSITFQYVVTVPGNYHYVCHPSTPHGEDAYIIVTCSSGVPNIDINPVSVAYPNPFSDKLIIETTAGDMIAIYNLLGEKIKSVALTSGQTKVQVEVPELNSGIYFYSILKEGVIVETRKLVKE